MDKNLSGKYLDDFNEVTKYLKKYAAKGEKLNEVLDDLSELYSDLEAENAPISSAHEGTAEDYAKELLENLPKKKTFFTTKRFVLIFAVIAVLAGICFYSNSPLRRVSGGLNYAANHPDDFSFEICNSESYILRIWDGGVSYDNKDYIEIKEMNIFSDGEIFIEGTAYPLYKDVNHGSITVPCVYSSAFLSNPRNLVEKISNYEENNIRILEGINTGCGIYMDNPEHFGVEILYRGIPTYYKINSDGSVDFKFVFEKTESAYNKKTISELVKEGPELKLVLNCLDVEWTYNK